MPGRNGLTTARQLKANPATRDISILFLSGMTAQQDRLAGLRAGAVDYISKPFDIDEVLERIRIHLSLSSRSKIATGGESFTRHHEADIENPLTSSHSRPESSSVVLQSVAAEYIFQHIESPNLKSSDVAAHLKISTRRLNDLFAQSSGMSAFEFIRQERMRRAALMLSQSVLTIGEIALEVGYTNPANFATEFRKFWDKSPSQLRTESQADIESLQKLIASKMA